MPNVVSGQILRVINQSMANGHHFENINRASIVYLCIKGFFYCATYCIVCIKKKTRSRFANDPYHFLREYTFKVNTTFSLHNYIIWLT